MITARPLRRDLGLAAWNTHNASPKKLRRFIRSRIRRGDVAIVLTEVWRRYDDLQRIARDLGLTMLGERPEPGAHDRDPVPEHGDTVMLLAPAFELESWEVVVLREQWLVYSSNRVRQPRRLIHARGRVDGQRVELLGVHGPTDIEANEHAMADFVDVVSKILTTTRPGTITAAVGDINLRLDEVRPWAARIGAQVSGRGPDLVLAIGAFVSSRTRGRRGSDHYALAHKLSRRRPRRRSARRKETR